MFLMYYIVLILIVPHKDIWEPLHTIHVWVLGHKKAEAICGCDLTDVRWPSERD